MTLAVANGVHILVTMRFQMEHGAPRDEAMVESLRLNFAPVMLTSITTMIGFLSMTVRTVPPIKVMATVTAIGVFMSFLYAVIFMPALISRLPVNVSRNATETQTRMRRLADWVIARRTRLLWSCTGIALVLSAFLPTLEFNNQFVNFLKERVEIRRDTDYAAEHLTGIFQIIYSIDAAESGGIASPEYLETLDAFREWLLAQQGVTHVESISSTVKRLNQLMARGAEDAFAIPASRAQIDTMLNLYERSLPKGLSLRATVNADRSASRMVVTTDNLRSREMGELATASEAWLRGNAPAHMHAEAMGPWVLFSDISDVMRRSMVISTPLALVLVSAALIIALRSLRFGLVSLVPNLLPLAAAYGIWAMVGKDLDLAMTGVMAMGIGIIVDDSVHFITKYLRARRERGVSPEDAVRYAFTSVGTALIVTSLVLVAGFLSLMLSLFTTSVNMGMLTTLIILIALAGDLFFLPAILILVDRDEGVDH
jgi:predicted RND superfamily exporter protein